MPQLAVADADGIFRPAKGLWVADADGIFRPARGLGVADADGIFRSGYGFGPMIESFDAVVGDPAWSRVTLSWQVERADMVEVVRAGTSNVVASSPAASGSVTIPAVPNTYYSFALRALTSEGQVNETPARQVSTAAVPAPSNVQVYATSSDYVGLSWDAVADATSYDVVNTRTGLVAATTTTAAVLVAVKPSTYYVWAVRARVGSASSGYSAPVYVTSGAAPAPASGTYVTRARSAVTYAYGSANLAPGWRPEAEGIHHGSVDDRGPQIGLFFYPETFGQLAGGRVVKLEAYLSRVAGLGDSGQTACRFRLHDMTGQPAGEPALDALIDTGALAPGESAWIELPADWGQRLVSGSAAGIGFGGTSGRYIFARPLAAVPDQGALRLTLG